MSKNQKVGSPLSPGEEILGRLPGGGGYLAESYRAGRRWTDKGKRKEHHAGGRGEEFSESLGAGAAGNDVCGELRWLCLGDQ